MFREQPLVQHKTVGELLHSARANSGVSIAQFAEQLRIAQRYLEALEAGKYNDLPSPVYIKNYLRLYSKALQIPWERIEKRYEQEISVYYKKNTPQPTNVSHNIRNIGNKKKRLQKSTSQLSSAHDAKPLVIKRAVTVGLVGIIVLAVVLYFIWSVLGLISPPPLSVTSPESDIIVDKPTITIQGVSEPEVMVTINSQPIAIEPDGKFSATITLREGLNTIRITSKKKLSQEQVEIRNVLYDIQSNEQIDTTTPVPPSVNEEGDPGSE